MDLEKIHPALVLLEPYVERERVVFDLRCLTSDLRSRMSDLSSENLDPRFPYLSFMIDVPDPPLRFWPGNEVLVISKF